MSKDYPSIDRIAELQQLIADFSDVFRVLDIADKGRRENDAEHSFGLALTCWYLAPKIAPKLNLAKILQYALAHDLVEVHSGDTYVFDESAVQTKSDREAKALEKLKQDWPDFIEMTVAVEGYQNKIDPEAKFVYTIDKMLPPILISIGEKSKWWEDHKVTQQMHEAEKRSKMIHSPEAKPYAEMLVKWMADLDYFYKPEK